MGKIVDLASENNVSTQLEQEWSSMESSSHEN